MTDLTDHEFGDISVRISPTAKRISIKLAPSGNLRISAPSLTPKFVIKTVINKSRPEIRSMLEQQQTTYLTDQEIGKSHSLVIQAGSSSFDINTIGTKIVVNTTPDIDISNQTAQSSIRSHILKALRKEAKSYLPRRLSYLAKQHGFDYKTTKLTHASSRWGSCSSSGTISMNISLMRLPFELIDYVLIHELCHTKHMNHSNDFWQLVGQYDPAFEHHRRELKKYTPSI